MRIAICVITAALSACSAARLSSTPVLTVAARPHVATIALSPGGGVLCEAVGIELSNRGFNVLDTTSTSSLLDRMHLSAVDIAKAAGLRQLQGEGIDALLAVHAIAGADGKPEAASVRLTDTSSGSLIAGLTWQNGSAGMQGSMADRLQRKGLAEVASDIAADLAAHVSR